VTPLAAISMRGNLISIGPLLPADVGPLFLWKNDAFAAKWDVAFRPIDGVAYARWLTRLETDQSTVVFAIRKLDGAGIIGFTGFGDIQHIHRSADLGVRIGNETDRGKGYGKEALSLVLHYAWRTLNLNRVQLKVFAHNERALHAYSAAGFEQEGRLRRAAFIDGRWQDVIIKMSLS
jgi:RimJ/RimL family protein N-acetyltransferase